MKTAALWDVTLYSVEGNLNTAFSIKFVSCYCPSCMLVRNPLLLLSAGLYPATALVCWFGPRHCSCLLVCTPLLLLCAGLYPATALVCWFVPRYCSCLLVCTPLMLLSAGLYPANALVCWFVPRYCSCLLVFFGGGGT
jgi:hypothetical protein